MTADQLIHATVFMLVLTNMIVQGQSHGTTPFDWPDLADMLAQTAWRNPLMAGALGYMDDVFPSRLSGPTS
jgi:hypothetical protein